MTNYERARRELNVLYMTLDDSTSDALDTLLRHELSRRPTLSGDALLEWARVELEAVGIAEQSKAPSASELVALVESGRRSS